MSLVAGNEYLVLTDAEYTALEAAYTGEDGLVGDFFNIGEYWYAPMSSISDDEYDFLMENEWCHPMYYTTSTQPGGGM